jgi:uncharacterized damage-inducible protein DinB
VKLTEYLLSQLDRESERCRRALEQFPVGLHAWKPHERSLELGYVAMMVATIPSWIAMEITQDELDIAPKDGPTHKPVPMTTSSEYLTALDGAVASARSALTGTTDAHLSTTWRLLTGGRVAQEAARHVMIQDTFNHLSHHRGQMTVYLRLLGAKVPALFGPSADDPRF